MVLAIFVLRAVFYFFFYLGLGEFFLNIGLCLLFGSCLLTETDIQFKSAQQEKCSYISLTLYSKKHVMKSAAAGQAVLEKVPVILRTAEEGRAVWRGQQVADRQNLCQH